MATCADRELLRIRLRLIDLMKSFFSGEPDAEMLSRWRGIFAAMGKQPAAPGIDGAVGDICRLLATMSLGAIQQEYGALCSASGKGAWLPIKAFGHFDGRADGERLFLIRRMMGATGLVRRPGGDQNEDSLPLLLDLFASLLEAEHEGREVQEYRCRLLVEILLPLSQRFEKTLQRLAHGGFYPACSRLLCCYLLLEKELAVGQ